MRDLRRDETWLADYAARKAAQRVQGRAPGSFQTQGSTSVNQYWTDREGPQTQGARDLRRMESNPARSESGSAMCSVGPANITGVATGSRNGLASESDLLLTKSTSGDAQASATCAGRHGNGDASAFRTAHSAGKHRPGPLTQSPTCADAAETLRGAGSSAAGATNKYRNVKTDGYASRKEAKRAAELRLLLAAGEISDLREQVPYVLIPRQLGHDGKAAERACTYIADFVYRRRGEGSLPFWPVVVEDVKSSATRTAAYIVKRKLMRFVHGIVITET